MDTHKPNDRVLRDLWAEAAALLVVTGDPAAQGGPHLTP
jgi:hypothetical protein